MDMSISLCIGGGGWRQPGGAAGGAVAAAMADEVKVAAVSCDHIVFNRRALLRREHERRRNALGSANFGVRRRREIATRGSDLELSAPQYVNRPSRKGRGRLPKNINK